MESTEEIARLERRIESLERRGRWTAMGCVALAALALAGFTRAQQRVVRAEKFELVDTRGGVVSEWQVQRTGPVLRLGRLSEAHAEVGLTSPGDPAFHVVGPGGNLRISLGLESAVGGTALFMYGPEPVNGAHPGAAVTLLHVPRRGPELWLREGSRTVLRAPAGGI